MTDVQTDIFDCIEVSETGSDGRPTTEQLNERGRRRMVRDVVKAVVEDTPRGRAQAVRDGRVRIEERCPHCDSSSLQPGEAFRAAHCVACGREIPIGLVRAHRTRRIRAYLAGGVV